MEGYLRSGKTYFVVAGAAHMGGANGVLDPSAPSRVSHRTNNRPVIANRADDEGPHKG